MTEKSHDFTIFPCSCQAFIKKLLKRARKARSVAAVTAAAVVVVVVVVVAAVVVVVVAAVVAPNPTNKAPELMTASKGSSSSNIQKKVA